MTSPESSPSDPAITLQNTGTNAAAATKPKALREFTALTWNLHGKHLSSLQAVLDRTEDAWDVLFLQELGGFASVPKGDVRTEVLSLSGESYHVCVYQAPMSHHCIANSSEG